VLPLAGKSPLVYLESSLSAVFWNPGHCGNLAGYGVLKRARIRGLGQPSTSIRIQIRVRVR